MKYMRKLLCLALAAVMLLTAVSCASKLNHVDPVQNGTARPGVAPGPDGKYPGHEDEDVGGNSPVHKDPASNNGLGEHGGTNAVGGNTPDKNDVLGQIGGWWKHVGGSDVEDQIFVELMYVDADAGTWTEYSKTGIRGETYTVRMGEYGLEFVFGAMGTTILNYDGVSLINLNGTIEFIPGEKVESPSPSAYNGTYYLAGDRDKESIVIEGVTAKIGDKEGTFTAKDAAAVLPDGTEGTYPALETSSGRVLFVTETGNVLFDRDARQMYIREEKIGTPEGEDFVKKYDLVCSDWAFSEEESTRMHFDIFGRKIFIVRDGGKTELMGTWDIHEYELCITYSDGHEEITPYDTELLMFSYYNHLEVVKVTAE